MKKILLLGGNGYIGSSFYKNTVNKVDSVDLCLFNKDLVYSNIANYNNYDINSYDIVICLAGHSSVPMCEHSPDRSWTNNVQYFRNLCEKLSHNQKLIYASSASVYGTTRGISYETSDINFHVLNHYDLQKITIDLIANKYIAEGKNIIGLRFGTVNGVSPNTRADLMINSMVKSAIINNTINVKNIHIRRAILGINDLCRALDITIQKDIHSGQYNLASFNGKVGEISSIVSDITKAKIIEQPNDALAYDFELSTDKFQKETGFVFEDKIENLIQGLLESYSSVNFDIRDNDRKFKHHIAE